MPVTPKDLIGREIAHYRIREKLGSGAMGEVYKAEDPRLRRIVALKLLFHDRAGDEDARRQYVREARAASSLDHPAICTVYDVGEIEGATFIVMAYYDAESLSERLERGALDVDEALDLGAQVARGLERAHEHGVVHRDVKPANVLVTARGEAKIVDFGMAKLMAVDATLSGSGGTPGTPAYMSPEQILNEKTDHRADIWGLGVTLYESLAGRLPFTSTSLGGLVSGVIGSDPVPLRDLREDVPADLGKVVAKMLAKDPVDRYPSCGDVAADLDRVARGEPVSVAAPRHESRRAELWWRIGPLAVAAAAIVSAALYLAPLREPAPAGPDDSRRLVVLPFTVQGDPELAYLESGMVELLADKLDGAGPIRAVDPHALLGHLRRHPDGAREPRGIAAYFQAGGYVVGSVLRLGNDLRLEATLYDSAGELLTRTEVVAKSEDALLEAIDALAQGLISGRLGGPGQRLARLASLTTGSLPALKAYLAGEQALRDGQFTEAETKLQEAVAADPDFALAWYRLWSAAGWGPRHELAAEALERTKALADRLGPRERDLFAAAQARGRGAADEAEHVYRNLLGQHPNDVEVLRGLADLLYHDNPLRGRPAAEAAPYFERALAYDPENREGLLHMVSIHLSEGSPREAKRLLDDFLGTAGRQADLPWNTFFSALDVLLFGAPADREAKLRELRTKGAIPLLLLMDRLLMDASDYPTVRHLAEGLAAQPGEEGNWGLYQLGFLELAAGRPQASEEALGAVAERFPGTSLALRAEGATLPFLPADPEKLAALRTELLAWDTANAPVSAYTVTLDTAENENVRSYLLGLVALRRGDPAAGVDEALSALAAPRSEDPMAFALAATLRALVVFREGDPEAALRELELSRLEAPYFKPASLSVYAQGLNRYLRAEVLRELGRPEEALDWYRSLLDGYQSPAMPYFGAAWLGQAEVHEQLGHRDQALQAYDRFLELWKDADPVLRPRLEEARRRRADLLREDPEAP